MLIFNNQQRNHLSQLEAMFKDADRALITSPFLMEDLTVFFDSAFSDSLNKLILYTILSRNVSELIRKANSLISIFDYSNQKDDFAVEIRIVNNLHGKAYIAYTKNKPQEAIVSSANLTNSGLTRNYEWGLKIEDSEKLSILCNEIENLSFNPINEEKLIKILYQIDKEDLPEKKDSVTKINLTDIIDPKIFEEGETQIWLKPIGHTESPINAGEQFGEIKHRLHFSKRRPTGVKIDDILITYGVGARAILSIYKVLTKPQHITDEEIKSGRNERWPWYVIGENLAPEFGKKWWEHDLKLKELADEFLSKYPEKPITDAGTQSFGAFNYGADKLHLDRGFGNWLYNIIIGK